MRKLARQLAGTYLKRAGILLIWFFGQVGKDISA